MTAVTSGRRDSQGYLPIEDYGLIGDCRSAALVGADGSIDWLCLPRFDNASLFGRIIDSRKGGFWQISPTESAHVIQRYRDRSNVLRTTFVTASGRINVTDFMPADEQVVGEHARAHSRPRVVRMIECLTGEVELDAVISPAPDYARSPDHFRVEHDRLHADAGEYHFCVRATFPLHGERTRFTLRSGEHAAMSLHCGRAGHCPVTPITVRRVQNLLRATQEYWWHWIETCRYAGPFQEHVWRSALALKLLTYAPTGAIVAAPTTSLPERIGGDRNWDYRFTWLRDASFSLFAFFQLGFTAEAKDFFSWLRNIGLDSGERDVPTLYTLSGSHDVPESILPHMEGYRRSAPVRIGNAAVDQLQLDVYGELLDSAYLYARFGNPISGELWRDLRPVVELAVERWSEPDRSIWEPRGGDKHYTYSKLMCWVAVDRGLRLAERFKLPHDSARWRAARRAIHLALTTHGFSKRLNSFTQTFDGSEVDAALLRVSQTRLLRDRDPRVVGTIRAVERHLGDGIMVRRYRRGPEDHGVHSNEGGFLMTSFWLSDALAHIGELERAQLLFEQLAGLGSGLNLFAEEADSITGELIGNFPQAFTHLALIGAAVNIERARRNQLSRTKLRS